MTAAICLVVQVVSALAEGGRFSLRTVNPIENNNEEDPSGFL